MHARRFAGRRRHLRRDSAGTAVPAGLRIATLTDGDAEDPARHRAWCLLAALLGQLEPNAASSNAPGAGVPAMARRSRRPSATAFWELLACARRSVAFAGNLASRARRLLPRRQRDAAAAGRPGAARPPQPRHGAPGRRPRDELHAAGIEMEQLAHLRQLSAVDLSRLAAMRSLTIGVTFDGAALRAGLRAVALVNEAKALETYFIRHGASTHLMSALFKLRRKLTLKRRRDIGARRPAGRVPLPDYATRERIYQAWRAIADPSPAFATTGCTRVPAHPDRRAGGGRPRVRGRQMNARMESLGITPQLLLEVFDSGELSSLPGADHRRRHIGIDALAGDLDQPVAGAFCRRLVPPLPGTVDTGDRALALGAGDRARALASLGLLEERRVGMPAKLWFRVRADAVWRALQAMPGRLTGERRRRHVPWLKTRREHEESQAAAGDGDAGAARRHLAAAGPAHRLPSAAGGSHVQRQGGAPAVAVDLLDAPRSGHRPERRLVPQDDGAVGDRDRSVAEGTGQRARGARNLALLDDQRIGIPAPGCISG